MKLSDILKLNDEIESLNIIQTFLSQQLTQEEFERAAAIYLKIANINNLHDIVLSQGKQFLNKFYTQSPTKYRQEMYKYLIDSAIKNEDYTLAKQYIETRKTLLPIIEQYISLLDELNLKKHLKEDYYDILIKLTKEVTPDNIKFLIDEELLQYYISNKKFLDALEITNKLKSNTLNEKYDHIKVELLYELEQYQEVIDLAEILKINNKYAKTAGYLISSLVKLQRYTKATTMEAEFEELIDNIEDIQFKIWVYKEIINLYEILNNDFSKELYEKKIKKISKNNITIKEEKEVKEKIKVKEIITTQLISHAKYLEHFDWLRNWMIFSHKIDLKINFREYLRQLFILINEKITFKEVVIYINNIYESNLFNYKKERLYDKKVIKQYVDNTIISETISKQDDIFGIPNSLNNKKDVLTQKEYTEDIKYIYSYYVTNDIVIVFYMEEEINDPSIYHELLSGIALIVYMRILDEQKNQYLKQEANYFNDILNNQIMPIRIMSEYQSKYNLEAQKLFNIEKYCHFELFIKDIPINKAKEYQNITTRLFNYPNETKLIEYNYQDLTILEYMFAIKIDDKVNIISFFIDLTSKISTLNHLEKVSTIDQETGLMNKNELNNKINAYMEGKHTFILVELNNDLRNIYGNERMHKFFIEFAKATQLHFEKYDIYRYDFNQLIIVFDFNDIRTVGSQLADYFHVINSLNSKVLRYEKFKAKAGVLRYPVVTVEKNVDRLYRYLDIALQKAKNSNDIDFEYFIYADYESDVFEQEVIDYLNTAIENKQLSIRFKQIIDIENNLVWNYQSEIYLPTINIDANYLTKIAQKRKKIVELELFHIELVCSFLQTLEEETNHFIKVTIPISKETFLSQDFQGIISTTLKKYNIPADFIRLLCDIDIKNQKTAVKMEELIKKGISIDTTYVESALTSNFNAVHLPFIKITPKWKSYYKVINNLLNEEGIAFILTNVNTKDDRETIKNLGIKYIEGNLYKKIEPKSILNKIKERL